MPDEENAGSPFYESRRFRIGLLVAAGLAGLVMAAWLRSITTPILVSLVLAYVPDPLVRWLQRLKLKRWMAVTAVYVAFLAVIAFTLVSVIPPVYRQLSKFPSYVERLSRELDLPEEVLPAAEPEGATAAPAEPEARPGAVEQGRNAVRRHLGEVAMKALGLFKVAFQRLAQKIGDVIGVLIGVVLIFIYTFFFLLGFPTLSHTVRRYLPGHHREEILRIWERLDGAYSNFFRGRLTICLCSGVLTALGLWITGIPFWLLIGMTTGILGIIPFIGVLVGLVPAVILAFLAGQWSTVIGVLVVFAVVQVVEPLLTPLVLSGGMKLHPLTILIGLLVGGELFGLFGAVISVPLVSTAKILGEEFLLPPLRELADEEPATA